MHTYQLGFGPRCKYYSPRNNNFWAGPQNTSAANIFVYVVVLLWINGKIYMEKCIEPQQLKKLEIATEANL
jgi:hypothetical protein